MSSKKNATEMNLDVTLDEPLTSNSCVKLVVELLKYILYQKQQIPFTYESLTHLQAKVKPTDRNSPSVKALLHSFQVTSDELSSQFHLEGCKIKEVAILIGATIISPKLHIRIELPSEILSSREHFECKHISRKPLLSLMRSMLECPEFQDAMTLPLNPTNTFVLLEKSDNNLASEFFLPKPQYVPTIQTSSCFRIKFHHNEKIKVDCSCIDMVKVYHEISESHPDNDRNVQSLRNSNTKNVQAPYKWYQSKEVIKGFKFLR